VVLCAGSLRFRHAVLLRGRQGQRGWVPLISWRGVERHVLLLGGKLDRLGHYGRALSACLGCSEGLLVLTATGLLSSIPIEETTLFACRRQMVFLESERFYTLLKNVASLLLAVRELLRLAFLCDALSLAHGLVD
jgi:hypothetical protein